MKLRGEQEEVWNNIYQANEDPKSIRSRESSNGSLSIPVVNGGEEKNNKDVTVEEPCSNENIGNDDEEQKIETYLQEEVPIRSRERSFEHKPKLMSPQKLKEAKKRYSIENNLVRDIEVELANLPKIKDEDSSKEIKVEDKSIVIENQNESVSSHSQSEEGSKSTTHKDTPKKEEDQSEQKNSEGKQKDKEEVEKVEATPERKDKEIVEEEQIGSSQKLI